MKNGRREVENKQIKTRRKEKAAEEEGKQVNDKWETIKNAIIIDEEMQEEGEREEESKNVE